MEQRFNQAEVMKDPTVRQLFISQLGKYGFALLTGLDSQRQSSAKISNIVNEWTSNEDDKSSFTVGRLGFQQSKGKLGVRFLSGSASSQTPLPEPLKTPLGTLGESLDVFCTLLTQCLSNSGVFGDTGDYKHKLREAKVCLFQTAQSSMRRDGRQFGMIDVVKYDETFKSMTAHADPGLFSVGLFSDVTGLQFQVGSKFVDVPLDSCIIWCGLTAKEVSDGRLRAAVHRVKIAKNAPSRSAVWYEAIAASQIPWSIPTTRPSTEGHPTITISIKGLTGKTTVFQNLLTVKHYVEDIYMAYQDKEGMPPAKTRLIYAGKEVCDYYKTLEEVQISDGAVLHSVLRLRGKSDTD